MKASRAVLLLAAVLFAWNIWGYDLWAPDEPYFGEGAREMVADGQWAVPHVNGVVTTDKPPLFFWLIALCSLPFGTVLSATARLPSVIAGLVTVALTMRLGRRTGEPGVGELAGLMLTVNFLFWDKARTAQIDGLLCMLILVALSAFESWRAGDADGRRAGLLFWLAAALAVLAKGPVGMLLPLGVALVTLVVDRRLRDWRRFAPWSGPALFVVVVASWMALATIGGGGEYSVWGAFREHVLDRAVHGMHHAQPFWYYAETLPVRLLPWSFLLPGALLLAWRRRDAADRFLLVFGVFVVVFFSISTEKRDLYVLPAFPAFALLMARLVDAVGRPDEDAGRVDGRPPPVDRRWLRWPLVLTGALFLALGVALPVAGYRTAVVPQWIPLLLGVAVLASGLAVIRSTLRGRYLPSVGLITAGIATAYLIAAGVLFPALDPVKSSRAFSMKILEVTRASREAGHVVPSFHLSNLPEAFSFYTRGVYFPEIEDPAALAEHLRDPQRVFAVADADSLDRLPPDVRASIKLLDRTRLSRKDVVIVANR